MSCEVTLSPVDFDEIDERYGLLRASVNIATGTYHEAIFSPPGGRYEVNRRVQSGNKRTETEHKTETIGRNHRIAPMNPNVGGKAEITIGWGGSDGTTISGSVSGNVSDNNGNKAEVKVEIESDGSGTATVSAEHEKKSSS